MFNFKHRVHCWLKEAAQNSSKGSICSSSSKRSSSSRSSANNKSSGSSKSSTKLKPLEEKAKIAELEVEEHWWQSSKRLRLKPRCFSFREKFSERRPQLKCMQDTPKMMKQALILLRQKSRIKWHYQDIKEAANIVSPTVAWKLQMLLSPTIRMMIGLRNVWSRETVVQVI